MARHLFGGTVADWVFDDATADAVTGLVQQAGGVTVTFWSAETGGTQYTDLTDANGEAISYITSSTGADGRATGAIPPLYGPDGVWVMWASANSGPRAMMVASDAGASLTAALNAHLADTGNPHDTTLASLADVNLTGAATGQSLVRSASGTWVPGAGGGGGGGTAWPNTVTVAASDSNVTTADYVCDGIADDVQIQAAVNALRFADGGRILLSAGTYNLAAPVQVLGGDDADVEYELYIQGAGPGNTRLVVGGAVAQGLLLTNAVRCHISDLGLTVTGSSDGISATRSATPAAVHRSAWYSSIERVQVTGPWNGTHTGWGLDLGNLFRSRIANVEIGGVGNGIRLENQHAAFNAGDTTIERCFVEVVGNNAVAYAVTSTAGNMNQLSFDTCHAIANPGNTGTVCWQFAGAGATSHVRARNCNAEQFVTTVHCAGTAYDIDVDLVHVTLRNGATMVDFDGYNNRVRCGLAYVEPAATVTLVNDSNSYNVKPNTLGPVDIYGDTGSTVNATVSSTVLRDVTSDGVSTTISGALRAWPGADINRPITLTDAATVATDAARGSMFAVGLTANRTIGAPTNASDGQTVVWRLTAAGGAARTPVLATGAGGFVLGTGTPAVTVSAIAAGSTAELEAVYHAATTRWQVRRYQVFAAS